MEQYVWLNWKDSTWSNKQIQNFFNRKQPHIMIYQTLHFFFQTTGFGMPMLCSWALPQPMECQCYVVELWRCIFLNFFLYLKSLNWKYQDILRCTRCIKMYISFYQTMYNFENLRTLCKISTHIMRSVWLRGYLGRHR